MPPDRGAAAGAGAVLGAPTAGAGLAPRGADRQPRKGRLKGIRLLPVETATVELLIGRGCATG